MLVHTLPPSGTNVSGIARASESPTGDERSQRSTRCWRSLLAGRTPGAANRFWRMVSKGYHLSIQPRLFVFPSIQGEQIGKPCRVHNSGSYGWSRRQIAKHGTFVAVCAGCHCVTCCPRCPSWNGTRSAARSRPSARLKHKSDVAVQGKGLRHGGCRGREVCNGLVLAHSAVDQGFKRGVSLVSPATIFNQQP